MTARDHPAVSTRLGLNPGLRVWIGGHNLAAKRAIEPLLAETTRPPTGPLDMAFIAAETPDEADYFLYKLAGRLPSGATAWVISANDAPHTEPENVTIDNTHSAHPVRMP